MDAHLLLRVGEPARYSLYDTPYRWSGHNGFLNFDFVIVPITVTAFMTDFLKPAQIGHEPPMQHDGAGRGKTQTATQRERNQELHINRRRMGCPLFPGPLASWTTMADGNFFYLIVAKILLVCP